MNILLVDDNNDVRLSLSKFLREEEHHVLEASNGLEALEILENHEMHLVLSDIRMPVMDGQEMLRRIKSTPKLENLVVILITGFGEVKNAVDAMREGAYDYLLKPIDVRELTITIERIKEFLVLKSEHKELTNNFNARLNGATSEIKGELEDIRKAFARQAGIGEIGIFSNALRELFRIARKLHRNRSVPVLIEGETGTGKELLARYIHYGDGDNTSPFVAINCSAISPGLFESELFGYEGGAFSGANPRGQKGKIELAQGGSLFLDEIGDLAFDHQAKLLRVIQEMEYYRVGGLKKLSADIRLICSTNHDLKTRVKEEAFREDLYFRLHVGHLSIPPPA